MLYMYNMHSQTISQDNIINTSESNLKKLNSEQQSVSNEENEDVYIQHQQTTSSAEKLFNIIFVLKADLLINDDDNFNYIKSNNEKKQSDN